MENFNGDKALRSIRENLDIAVGNSVQLVVLIEKLILENDSLKKEIESLKSKVVDNG